MQQGKGRMLTRSKPAVDLELIVKDAAESFRWLVHDYPCNLTRWNYHPELEIHLIRESHGKTFVGDYIGEFGPGYLTIVGPNIPHNWVTELKKGQVYRNRDVVVQFREDIFHAGGTSFPELRELIPFLRASRRGLEFYGDAARRGAELIGRIGCTSGYRRLLLFLDLLHLLACTSESRPLASVGYVPAVDESGARIVNKVISYIMANLHSVSLGKAAEIAGMSEPTFSRFFKKSTGNTFVTFTHKIRISHACRLLIESSEPVTSVCFAAGYSNISNFNRRFLEEKQMTPSQFRRTEHASVSSAGGVLSTR